MAQGSWQLSLEDVVLATRASTSFQRPLTFTGVGTDTRKAMTGQLFIALKGETFDGHDFVKDAVKMGAAGVMVHKDDPALARIPADIAVLKVADTLRSLQALATFWRTRHGFKVIGITGSNGKTSTKEFARTILAQKFTTYASQGSFNNHWGVPFSLLATPPGTQIVIQEMGMNHAGEITELVRIAQPDIVVVTTVGSAHIGELGSQPAVAAAKEEIYVASPQAVQIFNIDNQWTIPMFERAVKANKAKMIITFSSFNPRADIQLRAEKIEGFKLELTGSIAGVAGQADVPVIGRHNVVNLMAASALALAAGMRGQEIWPRLQECRGSWGRNQLVSLTNGAKVLFDAYNANPESMEALVKNAFEIQVPGKKIIVLGAMMELGSMSAAAHHKLGELVGKAGFSVVWFMGPNAADFEAGIKSTNFSKKLIVSDSYEVTLAQEVGSMLNPSDIAVIKGSRAMKMERVLQEWRPVDFTANY